MKNCIIVNLNNEIDSQNFIIGLPSAQQNLFHVKKEIFTLVKVNHKKVCSAEIELK